MNSWELRFKSFSYLASLGALAICATALLGMHLEEPALRQWFGEGPPMRFNTAVALAAASISLVLRSVGDHKASRRMWDRLGFGFAIVPILLGFLTLLQFAFTADFGIDQLVYRDSVTPRGFPGRTSPEAAVTLVLLGIALLLMNRKPLRFQKTTRFLALLILTLPLITLTSSFFGADQLYSILPPHEKSVGAATNTAVALVLLSFALFFRQPSQGMAALFIQDTVGGMIARRHLIALIVVPFVITFLSQIEKLFGQNNRPVSLAIALMLALGGLIALNWMTARELDRLDREKQKDQKKLKEQEQLLSGVLDAVPVGIWITDSSGKIIRGNPAGVDIWRGKRLVGIDDYGEYKGWWAHNGARIEPRDWAMARALEKGETSVDETIMIECFDGTRKYILNSAMPLRSETGAITGAIVTNYDISRRYRLEKNQALVAHAGEELITMRDLPATLQKVASLMTQGLCDSTAIYVLDDSNVPRLVTTAHRDSAKGQAFDKLLNQYPPNPRTQLGVLSVLEKRRSLLIQNVNEKVIQSIAHDPEQAAAYRELLHSYMFVPMIAEDKKIGVLGFMSFDPKRLYDDVDLLAAEELGRLAALAIENASTTEKLRQAVQAREDVVAIVSHDLRSPLTVIMQSCDMVTRHFARTETPAHLLRVTQLAKSAGRRMHELIGNLLDLSHLESGQFVLQWEDFEGTCFVHETVELMRPLATEKGVQLHVHVPENLPHFFVDRTRLCQILNNLFSNAIKHTDRGGTISLFARLREDGWLEFTVTDTGVGIKSEHLPMLFDRYWKPQDSKGGFGLGLYVVKGILEAHGGRIQVNSKEGQGTSFTFTLPSVLVKAVHPPGVAQGRALLPYVPL